MLKKRRIFVTVLCLSFVIALSSITFAEEASVLITAGSKIQEQLTKTEEIVKNEEQTSATQQIKEKSGEILKDEFDTAPVPEMIDSQYNIALKQIVEDGEIDIRPLAKELSEAKCAKVDIKDEKNLMLVYVYDFDIKDIKEPEKFIVDVIDIVDHLHIDTDTYFLIKEAKTEGESEKEIITIFQDRENHVFAKKTFTENSDAFTVGLPVEEETEKTPNAETLSKKN